MKRDHEYKRHGTLTLMAEIDLFTGHVHALVKERHRSREFIEFLKLPDTAIEVILDNHSAHISRETTTWLAAQPIGRFTFTFTPTHGSWLNLIEGFFSKLPRSALRLAKFSRSEIRKMRRASPQSPARPASDKQSSPIYRCSSELKAGRANAGRDADPSHCASARRPCRTRLPRDQPNIRSCPVVIRRCL